MGSDSLFFIIIAICLIMSAYFSATETAFLSLNRIRMKNMADKGNKRAALVLELEEKYDNLLSTILIGNNIVNILSSSLATILFVKMLGDAKGASVSTIVTTVLVLIFGEISPKSIAKESPDKFALFSAPIIAVLVKILTPVNFVFAQWKKLLSHIFKSEEEPGITEEELLTIVDEAQAGGGIGEDERVLMSWRQWTFTHRELILSVSRWICQKMRSPKYLRTPDIRDFRSMRKILTRSLVFYIRKIFTTLFTVRM